MASVLVGELIGAGRWAPQDVVDALHHPPSGRRRTHYFDASVLRGDQASNEPLGFEIVDEHCRLGRGHARDSGEFTHAQVPLRDATQGTSSPKAEAGGSFDLSTTIVVENEIAH